MWVGRFGMSWLQEWGTGSGPGRPGVGTYLPKLDHGLTGDDLIVVQPSDKAEGLELTLPLLQLPQDEGSEDLHILKGKRVGGWRPAEGRGPGPSLERTGLDTDPCPGKSHFPPLP